MKLYIGNENSSFHNPKHPFSCLEFDCPKCKESNGRTRKKSRVVFKRG